MKLMSQMTNEEILERRQKMISVTIEMLLEDDQSGMSQERALEIATKDVDSSRDAYFWKNLI
jgi:hypothetical protein